MGAAGAAAVTALGDRERIDRLVVAAAGATVLLSALGLLGAGAWPVDRYPSGPAFIVPGVVAALVAWAALAALPSSVPTRGMERAGRRTLVVYVGHHAVRVVLDAAGWYQALRGPGWTAAAVVLTVAIAFASAAPRPVRAPRSVGADGPGEGQGGERSGSGTLAGSRK
jgi:peptidoglycan/LPS O-acetylase OafA/YrhL